MRRRGGSSDDDIAVTPIPTGATRPADALGETLAPADAPVEYAATITPLPFRTNTAADALGETITPADALASSETMTPAEALASGETITPAEAFARALDASTKSVDRRPAPGVLPEIARATYAVRRELARGGMGRILVADDSRLGRRVALKELIAKDRGLQRRFAREVRITARLQHPGIVPVYEAGHWPDGEPFYAMKLVAGTSLERVVDNKPELADRLRLVPNLVQLTEAMAYAHGNGVIHRDLKPANVLVGDYGETVVIDWGLAKEISERDDDDEDDSISPAATGMTMTGAVVGTPAYMPPEQARGEQVDARADVYSLGALMWHVLAGRPPYQGTIDGVLEQVRTRPPPPLSSIAPGVPAELATIVEHAMERDPDLRYPTARELAEELSRFQTGQLVSRHEYTTWQLFRRWVKRHRAAVMSGAALLVGASVVGVIAMRQVVAERDRARAISLAALEEQGRRELVEGRPFRASVYFSAAYRGGRKGEALRLMLGEAMRAVDANIATWTTGAWITQLAWTSKDELVAVADDGTVTLWDIAANQRTVVAGDAVRPVASAIADDGGRLAVIGETSLRIIDLRSRAATVIKLARFSPRDVVVMADGTVAVQGIADTGGPSVRLFGPDGSERALAAGAPAVVFPTPHSYTARGAVVTEPAGEDDDARPPVIEYQLVNAADIKRPLGRRDHGASYVTGAIDRAGTHFAAGTGDGSVQVWDVITGLPLASFDGHTRPVNALAFEPTGSRLASAGDDGVVRVWDLAGPSFTLPAPSTTAAELAGASTDGHVRPTARRNEVLLGDRVFRGQEELVSWVDTTADGAVIVSGARDGRVVTWEAASGRKVNTWELPSAITAGDVGPDGAVAVGTREGTARIFRDSGVDPVRLEGHASAIHALAWHPTRPELLSAADTAVRVWSPRGALVRYLAAGEPIARAWWAGNGTWIVVDAQTSLQVWDGTQGKLLVRLPHGLAPQAVPPIAEPVYGARSDGAGVARLGVTGFVAYPMPRETRPAAKLAATIADHVPWRLAGSELVPASDALTVRSDETKQRKSTIYDFAGETVELAPSQPALPLSLANSSIAGTYHALRTNDRDGARKTLAAITDTKEPRTAYEAAWAWHFLGDEQVAYRMALRAWSSWPDPATKPRVLDDVLRLAAWGELGQETVVGDLGTAADNKTRVALAKAYDDLGRFTLVTPTLEKLTINDDWQTRLLSLYLMARRAYTRGDFTIAAEELEIATRAVPAGKLPQVTLGSNCGDVPVIPPLDLMGDPAVSLAGLTQRFAADSFRTFSRVYDHRYALAARRLYSLLADKFGVPRERVDACMAELDVIAAASYAKPGRLDKALLRDALKDQFTQVTTCYRRAIDSDASVTGRVALRIEVAPNAKIANVDAYAEPETPALTALAECVRTAITKLELPRQSFTTRAIVYYPLTFGPPKTTPDAGSTAGPRAR